MCHGHCSRRRTPARLTCRPQVDKRQLAPRCERPTGASASNFDLTNHTMRNNWAHHHLARRCSLEGRRRRSLRTSGAKCSLRVKQRNVRITTSSQGISSLLSALSASCVHSSSATSWPWEGRQHIIKYTRMQLLEKPMELETRHNKRGRLRRRRRILGTGKRRCSECRPSRWRELSALGALRASLAFRPSLHKNHRSAKSLARQNRHESGEPELGVRWSFPRECSTRCQARRISGQLRPTCPTFGRARPILANGAPSQAETGRDRLRSPQIRPGQNLAQIGAALAEAAQTW